MSKREKGWVVCGGGGGSGFNKPGIHGSGLYHGCWVQMSTKMWILKIPSHLQTNINNRRQHGNRQCFQNLTPVIYFTEIERRSETTKMFAIPKLSVQGKKNEWNFQNLDVQS